nr:MAG TPA: hypothetical protein [Caudoviricetes sp.]
MRLIQFLRLFLKQKPLLEIQIRLLGKLNYPQYYYKTHIRISRQYDILHL